LFTSGLFYGQQKLIKKGDFDFDLLSFNKAIQHYEKFLKKTNDTTQVALNLAESYFSIAEYQKAFSFYKFYFQNTNPQDADRDILYRFALVANSTGQRKVYSKNMQDFVALYPTDQRSFVFHKSQKQLNFASHFDFSSEVKLSKINSDYSDFGFFANSNASFLVSNRDKTRLNDSWTGKPYYQLYQVLPDNSLRPLRFKTKSIYHQSTSAITRNGQFLYVTENNVSQRNENKLRIVRYTKSADFWSNPEDLSINSSQYNTSHPSLSADGKTLFFASDRLGGYGNSDLYKVVINEDGTLGSPVNLGMQINTPMRETFPSIDENGVLYFSSDGYPGYGGLDVYGINLLDPYSFPINLDKPINSEMDDFGYRIFNGKSTLSSNRSGGIGSDDIYDVTTSGTFDFSCKTNITGLVKAADLKSSNLAQVTVAIYEKGIKLDQTLTSENGFYNFDGLSCGKTYHLEFSKEGYIAKKEIFQSSNLYELTSLNTSLEKKNTIENSKQTQSPFNAEILFGFDKIAYDQKSQGAVEKMASYLKDNSNKKVIINAYTDASGPAEYNLVLSQKRADYIKGALVELGVAESQLVSVGKGEFKNTKNSALPAKRQRRTDFKIISSSDSSKEQSLPSFDPISFAFNSTYTYYDTANGKIADLAKFLTAQQDVKVTLIGHSDAIGNSDYNQKLSEKRANYIKNELIKRGVSSSRIIAKGMGENAPLIQCLQNKGCSVEDHRRNRRVEFVLNY
jgi:outer membrane protein OmpA-like peptidoglycan-associated protein